jgi:hypothetical protein
MSRPIHLGNTSNIIRFTLKNSTTGQGLTGLTGSSAGLIISTIADAEASATVYTQAASHIQTIAALGTFVAPSASNCRFAEVDSTNHPGLYEFQIADARFNVANAKQLVITVSGAASLLTADYEILFDPPANITQILGTASKGAAGSVAPDWGQVQNPATTVGLTGTTISTTQTIATVTNAVVLPSIPANWITAAGINAAALNGKGDWLLASSYTAPPTAAAIVTAVWTDLLSSSDFSTASSIGALLKTFSDPWATALPGSYGAGSAGNILGNVLNNLLAQSAQGVEGTAAVDSLAAMIMIAVRSAVAGSTLTAKKHDNSTFHAYTVTSSAGFITSVSP